MKINGVDYSIGADPEIFMGHKGQFVSAHDKIPGDKLNPFKVDKGAVQVDGMALEFNIDPANDYEEFQNNLDVVQSILKSMIGDHEFLDNSSVYFDEEFASKIPTVNLELGCQPDFNGWTMMETPTPDQTKLMRTAGGHVHIGGIYTENMYNRVHFGECGRLARILDETLGVYSVLWDKNDERRSMYGQAGCFRPKTYGMEYRTLSNSWIFKPNLVKFVYDSVVRALEKFSDKNYQGDESVRQIINTSDRNSHFFNNNPYVKLLGV